MSLYYPPVTKRIPCNIRVNHRNKWYDFVDGGNGFLYGIPYFAPKVVEFNVEDKSFKEIGPDLGERGEKYMHGIRANNGSTYCIPFKGNHFLKITPFEKGDALVQILDDKIIPYYREVESLGDDDMSDDDDTSEKCNRG